MALIEVIGAIFGHLAANRLEKFANQLGLVFTSKRIWRPKGRHLVVVVVSATETETGTYKRKGSGIGQIRALTRITPSLRGAHKRHKVITLMSGDELHEDSRKCDLVLMGGPKTNAVTKEALAKMPRDFPLIVEEDSIRWKDGASDGYTLRSGPSDRYTSVVNKKGEVAEDFGYVIRTKSPFNRDRTMVILAGIHTYGTSAAADFIVEQMGKIKKAFTRDFVAVVMAPVEKGSCDAPQLCRLEKIKKKRPAVVETDQGNKAALRRPKVVEDNLVSRYGDEVNCEDKIIVTDDFLAVIDGSTTKIKPADGSQPAGELAANAIARAIERLTPETNMHSAVGKLVGALRSVATDSSDGSRESPSASVVIYSVKRREVWRVGDCAFMIAGKLYEKRSILETHLAHVRSAYLQMLLKEGVTIEELLRQDRGRDLILPVLKRQHNLMNTDSPLGLQFSAISAGGVPEEFQEIVEVPEGETTIVLATDGYPKVCNTLDASEEYLAQVIKRDPLCIIEHVATKGVAQGQVSYDDRAYLRAVV